MHFGLKNTPAFYTVMIKPLRKECLLLFVDTKHVISCDTVPITLICNNKIIINDKLLYSNHAPSLLQYFPVLPKCLQNIACHLN